ncbi:MAG: transporter substrate-binding domain-containing protein [Deltaproteobacteria bacterium]|nr:transporter substrate-binding domain-containing protein [Deltaproteobacteria bacterium]
MKLKTILCLMLLGLACHVSAASAIEQTGSNGTLVIMLRNDLPLMSFLNVEGQPAGFFVDMWRLWAEKTGRKIEFHIADFKEGYAAFKSGAADIHSALNYSEERDEWMGFSQPIYEFSLCLFFSKKNDKALNISRLNGQKIGIIGGTYLEEQLNQRYPDIEFVPFVAIEDMIHAAREGKIRAFLSTPASTSGMFTQLGLAGEFASSDEGLFARKVHACVLKQNRDLLSLVDKGLDLISNEEFAEIEKHWVPDPEKRYFRTPSDSLLGQRGGLIRLTSAEKAWLNAHPTVKVSIHDVFPPVMFLSEGKRFQGIVPDYLDVFSKRIGIHFELVYAPPSELPELIQTRQTDMVPAFMNIQLDRFMDLTHSCFALHWEIVNRIGAPYIKDVKDLAGKKAVIVKNISIYDQLKKDHPEIDVYPTDNPLEAMKSVSSGNADAFIGTFVVDGYLMQKYQFANLKIAGQAGFEDILFKFAVRNDWPEFVSILNKAIDSITPREHDQIFDHWMPVRYEHAVAWQPVIMGILSAGGILGIISSIMLFWNRKLAKEVLERKKMEITLRESEAELAVIYDNVPLMLLLVDQELRVLKANRSLIRDADHLPADIVGLRPGEALKCLYTLDDPSGCGYGPHCASCGVRLAILDMQNAGQACRREASLLLDLGSGPIQTQVLISTVLLEAKGQQAVLVCIEDITERKRAEERVRASLAEKELLLKELYHRTRNNMQVIIGFLNLQSEGITDEAVLDMFRDTINRIKSMALLHQKLYQAKNLSRIDLGDYIRDLARMIVKSHARKPEAISLQMDLESVSVLIDAAMPCGLIINELISNALEHAFPGEREGKIRVVLRRKADAEIEMRVEDNGVGLPEGLDIRKCDSLGLESVVQLTEHQLRGQVEVQGTGGTRFRIRFRESAYRERV